MAKRKAATKKAFNFWTFLRSGLRRLSIKYPPISEVLNEAKRPYTGSNKRQKNCFECAICGELFPQKEIAIDHIKPCGSLSKREDVADFIMSLFCDKSNLQVLCDTCHSLKTICDKQGCTWNEAIVIQKIAAFKRLSANDQKILLTELLKSDLIGTTISKRVEQYREAIKNVV